MLNEFLKNFTKDMFSGGAGG